MVDISRLKPEDLWYFVGLVATDGNLSPDGRHIIITSKDRDHLAALRDILGLNTTIGLKNSGSCKEKVYSVLQFSDVALYKLLIEVGLSPKKSLTLGAIDVEESQFPHFLRGVIDGDGHITTWIHRANQHRQWAVGVTSAAPIFIYWLKDKIEILYGVRGKVHRTDSGRHPIYKLKFGKLAAKVILTRTYTPGSFALERKYIKSAECLQDENGMINYGGVIARVA